jgi:hypothetical protein
MLSSVPAFSPANPTVSFPSLMAWRHLDLSGRRDADDASNLIWAQHPTEIQFNIDDGNDTTRGKWPKMKLLERLGRGAQNK